MRLNGFEHAIAVRPSVKRDGRFRCRVPDEIGIDGHILEGRIELRKAFHEHDFRRPILRPSDGGEAIRVKVERSGQGAHARLIERSAENLIGQRCRQAGPGGERPDIQVLARGAPLKGCLRSCLRAGCSCRGKRLVHQPLLRRVDFGLDSSEGAKGTRTCRESKRQGLRC